MRFLIAYFFLLCAASFLAPFGWAQNGVSGASSPLLETYTIPGGLPSGAVVSVVGGVTRVENRAPGSFAVRFPLPKPLDAAQIASFRFDWKPSASTRLNLFFKIAGRFYGSVLTGPDEFRPGTISWGKALQTPQKGGGFRVDIPLRALTKAHNPTAKTLPVEEILLGNWSNEGYLMAGMGGNGIGDFYEFKNLTIVPFEASGTTPKLGEARFENHDLVIPMNSEGGVETNALKLRVFEKTYDLTSPFLRLETTSTGSQSLYFRAGQANVKVTDGAPLKFSLEGLGTPLEGSAQLSFASLKAAAKPLVFRGETKLSPGDFEADNLGFSPVTSVVDRVFEGARNGRVLRLTNPKTAARFDTLLRASLDAKEFPALHFWYRADNRVRLDFRFSWNGATYTIRFLDTDAITRREGNANAVVRIGTIENATGDGSWREARFDLLEALQKQNAAATDFTIKNLTLSDEGWMGNARGVQIFLDDFSFVPAAARGDQVRIELPDVSGGRELSWKLDGDSRAGVLGTPTSRFEVALAPPPGASGLFFLHLRAKNGAGNLGETATVPLWFGAQTSPN